MTPKQSRQSPARTPLSRDRVLRAAIDIADEAGVRALSMRKLGQMLGVEAMSLYNHVRSKDDLLNAVIDVVLAEVEVSPPGTPWKTAIRGTAISAHDVLVRHPWAASVMLSASGAQPARWRYMESILRSLREAGFRPRRTDHAYHVLDSHITGYTLWQVQIQIDPAQLPGMAATFLQELPPDEYPYLVEHVHQHLTPPDPADRGAFVFGLDLILDGLDRIHNEG